MSYRDVSDLRNMTEEQKARVHADNYSEYTRFRDWTPEQRQKAASNFGPNWASVLSGCGDQ